MSYVRPKYVRGYGPYYEEVEGHRDSEGKVRQKVLLYIGRNRSGHHEPRSPSSAGPPQTAPDWGEGAPEDLSSDKKEAREGIDGAAEDAEDVLARNEAERGIIGSTDAPGKKKEEVSKRRTDKAAEELRRSKGKAEGSLAKYHDDELGSSRGSRKGWSPQRKREAESVARRTGASMVQADALNQRAKRAGRAYDEVDWDSVQGKDLTYPERVGKLDQQLGRATRTKREASRSSRHFDSTVAKWERDPDRYQGEMEAASREMFYDMKAEVY